MKKVGGFGLALQAARVVAMLVLSRRAIVQGTICDKPDDIDGSMYAVELCPGSVAVDVRSSA